MPPGIDDDDVTRQDLRPGRLKILRHDFLPLALRDRDHDTGAEEKGQRQILDQRRALDHVARGIQVGGAVHHRGNTLRQHPGLGVVVHPLDLDVLEVGPVRNAVPPRVTQIEELQGVCRGGHTLTYWGQGNSLWASLSRITVQQWKDGSGWVGVSRLGGSRRMQRRASWVREARASRFWLAPRRSCGPWPRIRPA